MMVKDLQDQLKVDINHENMAVFTRNEGVKLFNDGRKICTSSDGVNVYGNINMTGLWLQEQTKIERYFGLVLIKSTVINDVRLKEQCSWHFRIHVLEIIS